MIAWTGVRDVADFGPSCVQDLAGSNRQEAQVIKEDCLYLNVWTPEWPAKSPHAVMVWLYGGGNTAGLASVAYLDGTSLSRRGIVLVTINYRVGILGFLAHPALTAESPHHTSGNYGLLDELAALKWVHDNIAKFGGDPGKVTLFGQSAGGIDTAYLVTSPLSKGLIHRGIQESGSPIHPIGFLAQDEQLGIKFAGSLKAPAGAAEAVKFLRSMAAPDLQKATGAVLARESPLLWPHVDGYLIPEYPGLAYKEGKEQPIPLMTGNNAREEPRNYDLEAMKRVVKANFGALTPQAEEFYGFPAANGGTGKNDPFYGTTLAQIPTDTKHRCGVAGGELLKSGVAHMATPHTNISSILRSRASPPRSIPPKSHSCSVICFPPVAWEGPTPTRTGKYPTTSKRIGPTSPRPVIPTPPA